MRSLDEIMTLMADPEWRKAHTATPADMPKRLAEPSFEDKLRDARSSIGVPPLYSDVMPSDEPPERGRLYVGKPGVGKTYRAVADAIAVKISGDAMRSLRMTFVSLPAYMAAIRTHEPVPPISSLTAMDAVVLDDIAQSRPPEWMRDTLYALIDGLLSYRVLVIATSNSTLSDIARTYGDSIASRIVALCPDTVQMGGQDRRLAGWRTVL